MRSVYALQDPIRVVKRCSPEELACVLSVCASPNDTVETIRYASSKPRIVTNLTRLSVANTAIQYLHLFEVFLKTLPLISHDEPRDDFG